jgi:hypothetical protein
MDLESKRHPRPLFRVGRDDDPWAVPDWAYTKEDRTFGNRFDDPMGVYRVLYASSQRLGCFVETLEYADIYALGWVSYLRTALAAIAVKLGMEDIDLSSLERAEPRELTQKAGRSAFELGYAGVCYHSRYGHSIENWAIFEDWAMSERFPIHSPNSRKVAEDDPDLLEALRLLGLAIGD